MIVEILALALLAFVLWYMSEYSHFCVQKHVDVISFDKFYDAKMCARPRRPRKSSS